MRNGKRETPSWTDVILWAATTGGALLGAVAVFVFEFTQIYDVQMLTFSAVAFVLSGIGVICLTVRKHRS